MKKRLNSTRHHLMRITSFLIAIAIIMSITLYSWGESANIPTTGATVTFPDLNLEGVIREAIRKPTGSILPADLSNITKLNASSKGISNLQGIQNLINLSELYLKDNQIKDITPIGSLTKLTVLDISYNYIRNIDVLNNLTNLCKIHFEYNEITNFNKELIDILIRNGMPTQMVNDLNLEAGTQQTIMQDLQYESGDSYTNILDIFKAAVVLYLGSPKAYVDYARRWIDDDDPRVMPVIENDRALVPVRFISENFNAHVDWDAKTATATILASEKVVKLKVSDNKMLINNNEVMLDTPAKIINGRMFIPLRKLAENVLGKKVFYDRNLIIISDKEKTLDKNNDKKKIDDAIYMFKKSALKVTNLHDETQKDIFTFSLHPKIEWADDSKHFFFVEQIIKKGQVENPILRVFETEKFNEVYIPWPLNTNLLCAHWLDDIRILLCPKEGHFYNTYNIMNKVTMSISSKEDSSYLVEIENKRKVHSEVPNNVKVEIPNIQSQLDERSEIGDVIVSKGKDKLLYNVFTYKDIRPNTPQPNSDVVVSSRTYLYDISKAESTYLFDGFSLDWSPGESKIKYCVPKDMLPFERINNYNSKMFETYIYDFDKNKSIKIGDFYSEQSYFSYDDKFVITYIENYIRKLYL